MDSHRAYLKSSWLPALVLAILALIPYLSTLNHAFLSDDLARIPENPALGQFQHVFWQPLAALRELLNYLSFHLGGLDPAFFRSWNLLFHAGTTMVGYLLLKIMVEKHEQPEMGQPVNRYPLTISPLPFAAAALFAVHPLVSESVTWISGGTYPQYAFFFLSALYSYLHYRSSATKSFAYPLSIILFFLALQSNEKVIPLALAFPLSDLLIRRPTLSISPYPLVIVRRAAPYLTLSFLWTLSYLGLLGARISNLETNFQQTPGLDNPLIQLPVAISSYLELFFWPKALSFYHSELSFTSTQFTVRALVSLMFLGLLLWSLFRARLAAFFLLLFLLSLSPTLTPFRLSWLVAERYVYLGVFALLSAFVLLGIQLWSLTRLRLPPPSLFVIRYSLFVIFALLLGLLLARTLVRNQDWQSQDRLWLATANNAPSSPQNHNNLGDYYTRQGNLTRATLEFETAVRLKPDYADAYHNLGNTLLAQQRIDEAKVAYERALAFNPSLWQSLKNLGVVLTVQGKESEAAALIEKAEKLKVQSQGR